VTTAVPATEPVIVTWLPPALTAVLTIEELEEAERLFPFEEVIIVL
jgi:hypothetical protein